MGGGGEASSEHEGLLESQTALFSHRQEAPSTFGSAGTGTPLVVPPEDSSAGIFPSHGSQDTVGSNQSSPCEVATAGVDSEIGDPDALEDEDNGVLPRIGYDSDTSADEEGEVLDDRGRKRIRPTGDMFEDSNEVLGNARSILRRYYTGPWVCWSKVPEDPKKLFWDEFKNSYFWKDNHAHEVRKNWSAKCSDYLRSKFSEARGARKRPDFIDSEIWAEMLKYWKNNESFQRQSEVNKHNRASEAPNGIGIFTGGSKPVVKHVAEYECFKVLCEEYLESHPEGYTQEIIERLWFEAVGGRKNRRVFAHGSFHRSVPNCRNPAVLGSSHPLRSGNLNVNQMEELKKSIKEGMRKKIEEDVQKSMEERIQRQLMKQRQEDSVVFQRMLDFQLSRYVHPNPQASTSLLPLMNSMPNLYASPNCQIGSFASHPGIMNTSFASQPTYMEQLHLAHPSIDASLFCDSRLGQAGTTHIVAGGLFGGEPGGTSSHHSG